MLIVPGQSGKDLCDPHLTTTRRDLLRVGGSGLLGLSLGSLLELKADMPGATLIPYPVATPDLDARGWWKSRKGQRIIVLEYCKYMAILGRDAILSVSRKFGDKGGAPEPKAGTEDAMAASSAS